MAAAKSGGYPRTIRFGSGQVRVTLRGNGMFSLAWRENGGPRKTTKARERDALDWAAAKARELDAGTGRQWVDAGASQAIGALRAAAPEGVELGQLVADVLEGLRLLDGKARLAEAARFFVAAGAGTGADGKMPVADAIAAFLAEYKRAPAATQATFGTELNGFLAVADHAGLVLADLTPERLRKWVDRPVAGRHPAPRTERNRITTWATFLNRARDLGWLPEGRKHAAETLRRPVIPDAGRAVLTPAQGRALLQAVREEEPNLEAYLLIGGWLGLRPSEIQRLTWEGFEWDRGYLHVSARVAGKTSKERFVPVAPELLARLQVIRDERPADHARRLKGHVAGFRSREFLSALARRRGIVDPWPSDVLRHSFCSYRLAVVQSIGQVAEEAGNSPAIIRSNYRRPMRAEDGAEWWEVISDQ